MSDHILWAEIPDTIEPGGLQRAYSFFGHPSSTSSIFAPNIDHAYMLSPQRERLDLELKIGQWLPGYGSSEYLFSDIIFFWPGDYVFAVSKSPGVYDMSWHGSESGPFLSHNFAKAVTHTGNGPKGFWHAGLPLDLIPDKAPYDLRVGERININVKYLDQPTRANYSASYWTWDEQGDSRIQRGRAKDDGSFSVNLSKGGLWLIDAGISIDKSGIWTATYSDDSRFNSGDLVPYDTIRFRTTLSVWVR